MIKRTSSQSTQYEASSATVDCLRANGNDVLPLILRELRPFELDTTAVVCKTWSTASTFVRNNYHSLIVHPVLLAIVMASLCDFPTLLRACRVCTSWHIQARAECLCWRKRVQMEIYIRKMSSEMTVPRSTTSTPFVVRTMRIASVFGGDIASFGGLVGTLRHALVTLRLLHELPTGDLQHLVTPSTDLVAVVEHGINVEAQEQAFVTASVERITRAIDELCESVAIGLALAPMDGTDVDDHDGVLDEQEHHEQAPADLAADVNHLLQELVG